MNMQLDFTPDQMERLARMASHEGKGVEQLAKDIVLGSIEENERFAEAVREGMAQADRGEFIEEAEMDARFERILDS